VDCAAIVEEEDVTKTDDDSSDLLFDRLSSDEGTAKERPRYHSAAT
jgi:hypothetical protein